MHSIDYQVIGKRIQKVRKKKKLSQAQLADRIYCTTTYLSYIETGRKRMSLETFLRIANALNVSANELLVDVLKDYETTTNHLIARLMARCNVHERKVALAVLVALVEALEEDRAARTVGSLYE